MKLKEIVDRAEDYDTEELTEVKPSFYTEAKTEEIQNALPIVSAAAIQSGLKVVKVHRTGEKEFLVLDADDAEATALQSLTKELLENRDGIELGSDNQDPEVLFVIADLPESLKAKDSEEIETGDTDE